MRCATPFLCLLHLSTLTTISYADITYTDTDFSSPITSPIQSDTVNGNVTINTSISSTPQINNLAGYGFNALNGTTFTLNNAADFTINADWGIRVVTNNPALNTSVVLNGPGDVVINSGARGIFVGQASSLTSDSKVNVTSTGVGIMAYESGQMNFNNEVTITTTATDNHGIVVQKTNPSMTDPTIIFDGKVTVDIQGIDGTAVNAQAVPVWGAQGGVIVFNEGLEAQTLSGNVIESTGKTQVTINSGNGVNKLVSKDYNKMAAIAEDGLININGKSIIQGHIAGINNGIVNLNLTADSTITGATTTNSGSGQVNLNMADSIWTMTETSDLTSLTLNNSHIIFNDTNFSQLTTDTLSGSGIFTLKTDLIAGQGDKLIVNNTTTGNHTLIINNQGSSSATGAEKFTVVETGDGVAFFSLKHAVEVGGYEYDIQKTTNTKDWELYSTGKKSSAAQAGISFLNSGYLLNYIGTQTLFQRMGELKTTNGQEGNFWIRGFAGKLNSFNSNKLHGFGMDYNGYQLGIDKLLPTNNGNLYIGGMLGYTHANPDYKKGTGTVKDYNVGLYGTYIDHSGFYIDTTAKYMYLRNRFDVSDTAGTKVNGTAKNNGYSFSIEAGKRLAINNSPLYLEPQAQITYSYMGSSTTHASNGLKVELNSYNSLLARTGIAVGYQINSSQNPIDVYLKTSYVKEFAGKTSYKLNHNKEKYNFKGGWVDSSIGINSQFNKRHNIYGELNYANGNRFNKQQINLGYRYNF